MNKVLALDPEAIETALDWYKVQPYIGHSKGLFLADFPRNWALEFLHRDINTDGWGFWDIEKLKEYLIYLKNSNTFIALNSSYDSNVEWTKNFLKLEEEKRKYCIALASRKSNDNFKTFDDLSPTELNVDSTIEKRFTPVELAQYLKLFFRNSPKIAFIDRHNYLTTANGEESKFTSFIKELLVIIKSSKCHEIIIYAKYDPDKYPYMKSNNSLLNKLKDTFVGCVTPTYGIKYICCSEFSEIKKYNSQDLHSRKILTNNVMFILSDSIMGRTYSQSITRIADQSIIDTNLKLWIDEDHGLGVMASATYSNLLNL